MEQDDLTIMMICPGRALGTSESIRTLCGMVESERTVVCRAGGQGLQSIRKGRKMRKMCLN